VIFVSPVEEQLLQEKGDWPSHVSDLEFFSLITCAVGSLFKKIKKKIKKKMVMIIEVNTTFFFVIKLLRIKCI